MAGTGVDGRRVVSPRLVGRDEELARLVSAVTEPPAVVVVEGEAGIGKTRLVTELGARPEIAACRFVIGSCRQIREPFPLGPIIGVVRGLGDELRTATLSPVAGALRPLLPEIADMLPPLPAPLDDRDAERHRVFRGLVEVLGSLGQAVVVLEDLHWADEHTVDFLSYLLAEPPPMLSLVLTFRGEDVHPDVRAVTAKLPTTVSRAHTVLAPLGERETGALAATVLGTPRVTEEFASYLCERASGLPFAIEELLALLQARGTLVPRGGGWARKTLDRLDVPIGIRDQVLQRVNRLSGDGRSMAAAAAVLQAPAPATLLVTTCQLTKARALRGLEEALSSRVLVEHGASVGFRHPLAAQAVYEALPGLRRQALHARTATALDALDPVPLGQLAHHLRHAGRLGEWVDAAEKAADQAAALGHDAEAVRLLDDVLRRAPLEPGQRGRIAVKLGRAAEATLGAARDVTDLLSGVLEQDEQELPEVLRGELRFRLAVLLDRTGDDPLMLRQRQLLKAAIDELDARPDLKAWAMIGLGLPRGLGVPLSEHRAWLGKALDTAATTGDRSLEVFVLGKVAMVAVAIGDHSWRDLTDRIVGQTESSPRRRHEVDAYYSVGMQACYVGHHETADRLLTAGLKGAAAGESGRLELGLRSAHALLAYCRGSWDGLDAEATLLLPQLDEYIFGRSDVAVLAGCLALARGDLGDARRRLADAAKDAEECGSFDLLPLSVNGLVRLAVARGEVDVAVARAQQMLAALEARQMWPPVTRALPAVVQAMVAAGQLDDARALVTHLTQQLKSLDAPLAPPALHHARGFLTTATGRWAEAADQFLAAAEAYEQLTCPYEAAQAREQAAISLLAGESPRAQEPLLAAMRTYQSLGATWDLDRAMSIGRRHGIPVPGRHHRGSRGYGDQLSPREQAVVELAVCGRTNREIARELCVSPNTVKHQLAAAMRKLGVRSRTALANRVATDAHAVNSKN